MAELPKYQQTGRVFADIPQLDFTNVRESFKRSQSIISGLDRLTSFAGKFAEKAVEEQAEQWAVDNQITLEQLDAANKQGLTMDDLLKSSGGGEIWQKTIRKLQGEQVRVQLENKGRAELSQLQKEIETGVIDANNIGAIRLKINSIGNGLFAPLKNVDVDSYVKGLSSFGAHSTALINEARKKSVEDMKNYALLSADNNRVAQLDLDKSAINSINDIAALNALRETSRSRVYESFAASGDTNRAFEESRSYIKDFDALVANRFVNIASSKEYAQDMLTAVKRINAGDFGESTALYQSLPEEEKKNIRTNSLAAWSDLYSATKKQEELTKIQNKDINDADVMKMLKMKDGSKDKIALAEDLFKRDVITLDTLKSIVSPKDEGDGDILAEANADRDIAYGRIKTERELKRLYPSLNGKQTKRLLMSLTDKEVSGAKQKIRVAAGAAASEMVPVTDFNTAGRIQLITRLYEDYVQEQNPDGTYKYNSTQAVNLAIEKWPQTEDVIKAKKKQTSTYKGTNANNGIVNLFPGFNPDTMSVDDYAARRKLDDVMKARLKRIYNDYQAAKATTGLSVEGL